MSLPNTPTAPFDRRVLLTLCLTLPLPVVGAALTKAPFIWPVSTLLYNIGLFFCLSALPNKAVRILAYGAVSASLILLESSFFFSFYLQNAGFNEAFFYHLRPDLLYAGTGEHLPLLLAVLACLLGFLALSTFALCRRQYGGRRVLPLAAGLLVFGLLLSPPAQSLVAYAAHSVRGGGDDEIFQHFGELRDPKVTAVFSGQKRPNIVLIYVESLDHNYFDETLFPGLLPNLKRLRTESIDFSNIAQGEGAGWTLGGIVASQCGYPLAIPYDIGGNDLGLFNEFLPRATCLGDLLAADGYRLTFIGGADARFAGKDDFLRSHGYAEIIDRDTLLGSLGDKSYQNTWGVFDDTLLDYAIGKFTALSSGNSPFLLTVLTMDTHHPNGFLSRSCGPYGRGENSSLNALHCADKLIPQFIDRIRNSPYSQNTLIVVASDHLTMRNQASYLLERSQTPERLTFFVNTPSGTHAVNNRPGIHYDIGPTILDLVGYNLQGRMGFGAPLTRGPGYLPGRFGEDQWQGEAANLLAIGSRLWQEEVTLDEEGIRFVKADLSLAMGGRKFNIHSFEGYSPAPTPIIFFNDDASLKLDEIKSYPFDRQFAPGAMSEELRRHPGKLALAIGRACNLPGFAGPRILPGSWMFFVGKPGSDKFLRGAITGDFTLPFAVIQAVARESGDEPVSRERDRRVTRAGGN